MVEALETRRLLSAAVWTGAGGDNHWSTAGNWQNDVVPAPGADVTFPDNGGNMQFITVDGIEVLNSLTVDGLYQLNDSTASEAIHLSDSFNEVGEEAAISVHVVLDRSIDVNVADEALFLSGISESSPGLGMTVTGAGFVDCQVSPLDYTGTTDVSGRLSIGVTTSSSLVQIDSGGVVYGTGGELQSVDLNGGALYSTKEGGSGAIIDSDLLAPSNSSLVFSLQDNNGAAVPTTITVNSGQVTLDNPTLQLNPIGALTATDSLTLIKNNTGQAISGTFAGLPEGSVLNEGGQNFFLSYQGGASGQDVTLTAAAVWSGAANDGNWNTPGNWQSGTLPLPMQDVDFPDLGQSGLPPINLASDVTLGNLSIQGNYQFDNSTITLDGNITSTSTESEIASDLVLTHNTNVDIGSSDILVVLGTSDGGNGFGITETGDGSLDLAGIGGDSYTGTTEIAGGKLLVDTSLASSVTVDAGGWVEGHGSTAGITGNGGTVSLSELENPSSLTSSGPVTLAAGSTLREVISNEFGEEDGQLFAQSAPLDLTGSTLSISIKNSFVPSIGDSFTLISNQTASPVVGTFDGLPEGAVANVNGVLFQVSYAGGISGQDVTLTVINPHPTVVSVTPNEVVAATHLGLNILGQDPSTGDDSTLTYAWSVTHAPSGAKPVIFSASGTNDAKNAIAHFSKDGTYHLTCTITANDGMSATRTVSIRVEQVATSLRLSPHKKIIHARKSVQYGGMVADQFGHAMRAAPTVSYAVEMGDGTISQSGLFTSGQNKGHVIVEMVMDDLTGTLGATIV